MTIASATPYDIGDAIELKGTFKDADEAVADPTAVFFKMLEPDGTATSYTYGADPELEKVSDGVFRVVWSAAKAGKHRWRLWGTGAVEQSESGTFEVAYDPLAA